MRLFEVKFIDLIQIFCWRFVKSVFTCWTCPLMMNGTLSYLHQLSHNNGLSHLLNQYHESKELNSDSFNHSWPWHRHPFQNLGWQGKKLAKKPRKNSLYPYRSKTVQQSLFDSFKSIESTHSSFTGRWNQIKNTMASLYANDLSHLWKVKTFPGRFRPSMAVWVLKVECWRSI